MKAIEKLTEEKEEMVQASGTGASEFVTNQIEAIYNSLIIFNPWIRKCEVYQQLLKKYKSLHPQHGRSGWGEEALTILTSSQIPYSPSEEREY